jgi:hypothetical protein
MKRHLNKLKDSSFKVLRSAKKHVSDLFYYVAESLEDQEKNGVVEAKEEEEKFNTEVELVIYEYEPNIYADGLEYHTGICIFGTEYYYCSDGILRRHPVIFQYIKIIYKNSLKIIHFLFYRKVSILRKKNSI